MNPQLSLRYSFHELTVTNNKALLETNRQEAERFLPTLKALAAFLEKLSGPKRLNVNSGFRCWQLNGATPGSSTTSQHTMGQAADLSREGQSAIELFTELWALLVAQKIPFGQLIYEEAKRDHGVAQWVHASLGPDFWRPSRCGEVRTMKLGPDGKPVYTLLKVDRAWELPT